MLLRSKKTIYIFTMLLTLIFSVNYAWAQENTLQIQKLEIQILPEYDTSDILLLNLIEFKNISDQNFSGELRWKVPKGSKTHIVTANNQPDNHLQIAVTSEEKFDVVTWKLPTPIKPGETSAVHLEYYYNNLQGSPDKTFSFEFTPDYPVSTAEVYVIQPIKATNFKLTPDFGQPHKDEQFSFFVKNFFMSPDSGIKIEGSYTKTDPNPSLSSQQTQSGEQQGTAQGEKTNNTVKILLALGIGAFIAFLIYKEIRNRNLREDDRNYEDDDDDDDYKEDDYKEDETELKEQEAEEEEENEADEQANYQEEDENELESPLKDEKRRLEEDFRDGRISESDYLEMLSELEEQEE